MGVNVDKFILQIKEGEDAAGIGVGGGAIARVDEMVVLLPRQEVLPADEELVNLLVRGTCRVSRFPINRKELSGLEHGGLKTTGISLGFGASHDYCAMDKHV